MTEQQQIPEVHRIRDWDAFDRGLSEGISAAKHAEWETLTKARTRLTTTLGDAERMLDSAHERANELHRRVAAIRARIDMVAARLDAIQADDMWCASTEGGDGGEEE